MRVPVLRQASFGVGRVSSNAVAILVQYVVDGRNGDGVIGGDMRSDVVSAVTDDFL